MEDYFKSKKKELEHQLTYRWLNGSGQDISLLLRGKIEMIDAFLDFRNIFERYDSLENKLKEMETKDNKGAK